MNITAHCIVKNEDKWVWFAIQSVLPFVDKIFIFDTGSTDKTVEIIKTINSSKIVFEKKGPVSPQGLTDLRQEQLNRTQTPWFLIVDGDEVWSEAELKKLTECGDTFNQNTAAVINKSRNCVGDVFHYLPDSAGNYSIAGHTGNLNIRLIKKTNDLKVIGAYPLESYNNSNGPIQNQDQNLVFCESWCLHTSFLKRSSGAERKQSGSFNKSKLWESGIAIPKNELPQVFNLSRPPLVEDPFKKRGFGYEIASKILTPIINLKRKVK